MNTLDKAINYLVPSWGTSRAKQRYAKRVYDGATVGRRNSSWKARHTSANSEIGLAIRPLRDRARELVRNSPHAPRMIDVIVANAVGVGIHPVPRTGNDKLDSRVMDLWNEWEEQCDVEGVLSFNAMQALAVRSMVESGETVIRFIDGSFPELSSPVPLQLQLLEADFIDQWREGIYSQAGLGLTANTRRSRLGIGLGEFDRRTGLWLYPWHPGEITTYNMKPGVSRFHPIDEVLHLYKPLRPGQVRGVPWFAPVLTTARELNDFLDAVLVKARVEACFSGFITNSTDLDPLMDSTPNYDQAANDPINADALVTTLEPGMLKELKEGQGITFAQPTTNTQIEPMMLYCLQAMAAGVGCTYDQATGDLRQANYSSLRAGKLEFRRMIEQLQALTLIPRMCKPVWNRFISRAILSGAIKERAQGYPCDWVTPSWEAIDPQKDFAAEMNEVRAGRLSPQEFIAARGNEWRKVQDDTAEFYKRSDELGLVFDIDPRRVNQKGLSQKTDPATGEPLEGQNESDAPDNSNI